jgi:hypothetical protein
MNEDFGPCTVWHKTIQPFISVSIGSLKLSKNHNTVFDTVANVQVTEVANLSSNADVSCH